MFPRNGLTKNLDVLGPARKKLFQEGFRAGRAADALEGCSANAAAAAKAPVQLSSSVDVSIPPGQALRG